MGGWRGGVKCWYKQMRWRRGDVYYTIYVQSTHSHSAQALSYVAFVFILACAVSMLH